MVKKLALIVIISVVVILAVIWYFTRPTPERRVRQRISTLEQLVSKNPKETNSSMALKMQRLALLMTDNVIIDTHRHSIGGTYTQDEFASMAMRVRGMMQEVKLRFVDVVLIDITETDAHVEATVRFVMREGELAQEETAEVRIHLVQSDDKWRFESFEEVKVLEK